MTEKATGDILLVEDNDLDVILTRQVFEQIAPEIRIHRVPDGMQAMAFLRNEEAHVDAPTPDLVLLDLNLPVMTGEEVMCEIVQDDRLKQLPVIILSNSQSSEDVLRMYRSRASSYIRKPVDFAEFEKIVRRIVQYWFEIVLLPGRC
jgi:CheY-like chemotaxis protein